MTSLRSGTLLVCAVLASYAIAFPLLDEGTQPGSYFSKSQNPLAWILSASARWMEQLPDDTLLNKLSIPGTHDTGALYGSRYCETQSWTIAEQLAAGIRFMDIRNRRDGSRFAIHHGLCFQQIYFDTVMDQVRDFLKAYPGETVIMRVKEEHTPMEGSEPFAKIWARYMETYGSLFVPDLGTTIPTLGQLRGKVLVFRNAGFSGVGLQYDGPTMEIQDFYKVFLMPGNFPFGDDTVSITQKKRFVGEYLQKAKVSSKIVLNYCSGAGGMFPDSVAEETNEYLYRQIGPFVHPKTTGILILDYPGARLIYRIVKTNFASSVECVGRTWRADSDRTWAEFRIPTSKAGTVYNIKKGAYAWFVFPKCHRATWTDLRISCGTDGIWDFVGSLDADGRCRTSNTNQKYVAVGKK